MNTKEDDTKKVTIQVDFPLDIIHSIYRMAIDMNTTADEVVEFILKEYMDEDK